MITNNIGQLLSQASAQLMANSDSPTLDAELLLACVMNKNRSYFRAWPERYPSTTEQTEFMSLLARRYQGEPIAYLVGTREFWSLKLKVSPATLIPRPETEGVVEQALSKGQTFGDYPLQLADLGTGCGTIALALAKERPGWQIDATDCQAQALDIARENAQHFKLSNISFYQGDWFHALAANNKYHIVVSNPPYIPANDPHLQQGDLRYEPKDALISYHRGAVENDDSGLFDLACIITTCPAYLHRDAWLIVEHGQNQGLQVQCLMTKAGFSQIETLNDLAALPRVTLGTMEQHHAK